MKRLLILFLFVSGILAQYVVHGPGGLVIELDTVDAFFAIGDTVGSSGRALMYDFHEPWRKTASPFIVRIGDSLYTNAFWLSPTCATNLRPYHEQTTAFYDGFATQWDIPLDTTGSVILTQRLRAILIDTLPACEIEYAAFNNDSRNREIGFYQNIDVLVGTNDKAPLAMAGGYKDLGDILTGDDVPYFWQAFERGPAGGTNQVLARGMLRGIATTPSVFAFGRQPYMFDDCWDIDTNIVGYSYSDAGVSLRWDGINVKPYNMVRVSTVYGFGEPPEAGSDIMLMVLVPSSVGSACDEWAQNPFEAAVLIYNLSISPSIDSLVACIHLDDGLELIADHWHFTDSCILLSEALDTGATAIGAWLVQADTAFFTSGPTDAEVVITVNSSTPAMGERVETTTVHIPDPMGIPPVIDAVRVPNWAVSCIAGSGLDLKYYIADDGGIDLSSMVLQLGSGFLYYSDSRVSWSEDTLTMHVPYYFLEHEKRIQHGIISLADSDGCIPSSMPFVDFFWVDGRCPEVVGCYPYQGSVIGDSMSIASMEIIDWPAGVDTFSINVAIEIDDSVSYYDILAPELSYAGSVLTFEPVVPWPDSSEIMFCLLSVADNVDTSYCPANAIPESVCFSFSRYYNLVEEEEKPLVFDLQVYPNPFNSSCRISAPGAVEIYDINGRLVYAPSPSVPLPKGEGGQVLLPLGEGFRMRASPWEKVAKGRMRAFIWQPDESLPSGVYLVRATMEYGQTITKRIVLIK